MGKFPTKYLSVFDRFVGLELKGFIYTCSIENFIILYSGPTTREVENVRPSIENVSSQEENNRQPQANMPAQSKTAMFKNAMVSKISEKLGMTYFDLSFSVTCSKSHKLNHIGDIFMTTSLSLRYLYLYDILFLSTNSWYLIFHFMASKSFNY